MTSALAVPTLTDEQRAVLEARDASVAVSAGAGCGKTFVLSERFLAELDPRGAADAPRQLDELIAFTYTERAAREMRDRVRRKCVERLGAASDADAGYWLDLLRSLDSARISTVHSFCLSLLRSHAVEAGVDPQFMVFDPAQADTLRLELIDDVLRARLEDYDAAATQLVKSCGLQGTRERIAALLSSRDWRQPRGGRLPWTAESLLAAWGEQIAWARRRILQAFASQADLARLVELVQSVDDPPQRYASQWTTLRTLLPRLAASDSPLQDLAALAQAMRLQGFTTKRDWNDPAVYEEYAAIARKLRPKLEAQMSWFIDDPRAWQTAAVVGLSALELAEDVSARFDRRKLELRGLDFDDLIAEAHRLLTDDEHAWIRRRVAERTRLLLVDEAQDSNRVQVELISALCGVTGAAGRMFVVGDYKQSIYRFLGAEPQEFRRLRAAAMASGRLPLTRNFRSQPAILEFVNAVFCDEFDGEYEPLRAHRPQVTPVPAVEFLWSQVDAAAGKPNAEARRRTEADWIAGRVAELFADPIPRVVDDAARRQGDNRLRPVEPRDVVILFRALSDVALYEAALQQHGIDYYLVGGKAFYAQQEIYDVSNLLRSIDSLCDDVSLVGVLRSPFFALADETLFWLARGPGGLAATLFSGKVPAAVTGEQAQAVAFAADVLNELRSQKDRLSIAGLLQRALDLTGYDAALVGEFLGQRKLANLRKLIDKARAFDRMGRLTLTDFVVQLTEFEARQPDEALAATEAESANVVRLMTVHQAKGLEFPVVVVANLGRQDGNPSKPAVYDHRWGPLVSAQLGDRSSEGGPDADDDGEAAKLPLQFYRSVTALEDRAEATRLFYVATTRAADLLVLSASTADHGDRRAPWLSLLADRFDLVTGELRVTLPPGYARPQVRVISERPSATARTGSSRKVLGLAEALAAVDKYSRRSIELPRHVGTVASPRAVAEFYSFSRLRGTLHGTPTPTGDDEEFDWGLPRVDPIGLGTLVHAVLEEVCYGGPNDVPALVGRHAPRHVLLDGPEVDLAIDLVQRFLQSPRAAELASARTVYRELEFLLSWPAFAHESCRLANRGVRLQGFIDCLYQDALGGWHVLDFKTSAVTAADAATRAEIYELQMLLYALAAEQALGQPPCELTLHFLRPGKEHSFRWNAAARERLSQLMRQALATT